MSKNRKCLKLYILFVNASKTAIRTHSHTHVLITKTYTHRGLFHNKTTKLATSTFHSNKLQVTSTNNFIMKRAPVHT